MAGQFILQNLTLTLDDHITLLSDVTLELPDRQITTIIGPSGSGKSTLLRCLNRLWEPPAGSIYLNGIDVTTLDVLALRRRVGMLFQSAALFEGTVADNLAYGPQLQGRTLSPARIVELLTLVGLATTYLTRPGSELSGGEAQRVALARTLANEPQVLLLDEPTSALDPAATHHVEETVLRLRDTLGLTVIWVSHAIEQVSRVADRVVLLVDGGVVETGTPEHLLQGDHHLTGDFAAGRLEIGSHVNNA